MNKKLSVKWVADTIGDDYKKWRSGDIILLQAQTGTGKTYFIKNVLIDYIEWHERILLVCNRTNLKRQLKIDLLKKYNKEIIMIKDAEGKDTSEVNMDLLDKVTTIDNIVITSYHALQESILDAEYGGQKFDLSDFKYIIMDEAHYMLLDGSFNNKCRLACERLIDSSSHANIKIFISATMEEVEVPIRNRTDKIFGQKPKILSYKTGIDYSYVNPKYFKNDITDIVNTIKNDKTEEKWLIFVSNKAEGDNVLEKLGEEVCSTIYSNTKSDELSSIINESKFNKKVLVCTKCLDNGINIQDELLTNIVIMTWDRITFLQMLGRKRVNIEDAQEINLYIPTRYKKSFISKKMNCLMQQNEVELLSKHENDFNRKYDNSLKKLSEFEHLFYRSNALGKWKINSVGRYRLLKDLKFYEKMIFEFKFNGEYAFIWQQLTWLELEDTWSLENVLGEVILNDEIENLEDYLENIVGKELNKNDQKELIDKIGLTDSRGRLQKSITQLNAYLEANKIAYIIKSERRNIKIDEKTKKESYWMVYKLITESSNIAS